VGMHAEKLNIKKRVDVKKFKLEYPLLTGGDGGDAGRRKRRESIFSNTLERSLHKGVDIRAMVLVRLV